MNTRDLLESKMVTAHDDFLEAAAEAATPEDMRELVEFSTRSFITGWALRTRHQVDFDLASAALQSIK